MPAARAAYLEACNAGSPPELKDWSHPVVYWSGDDCGWQRLATASEAQGWPLFQRHYQARCAALLRGDALPAVPEPPKNRLPAQALDAEAAREQLRRIRNENDL